MSDFKPSMSDEAVQVATGREWADWFAVLDAAGAQQMSHPQIVAYLTEQHQVGSWWRQMVTVTYEQSRGLRQKHQRPDGYQVSRSKTLPVPVERAFAAWVDEAQRRTWLPDPGFTLRKATPNHSLRITWVDGESSVDVGFSEKGPGKCQVSVGHSKLPDAGQAEAMKEYWGNALERLALVIG